LWIRIKSKRYKIPNEKISKLVVVGLDAYGNPAPTKDLDVDLKYAEHLKKYARHPRGMPKNAAPALQIEPEPAPKPPPPPKVAQVPPVPRPDPAKSGAFILEGTRLLWGMGVVTNVRDPGLARKLADARARKQVAVLLEYHIASVSRDENPDPLTRPVIHWERTVEHLEIADRWEVAEEKASYSIAVVELEKCGLKKELQEKVWKRLEAEGLDEF
jgi:hypothetical protein